MVAPVGRRRALLVADTHDDLPESRREAEAAAHSLAPIFDVSLLLGARTERRTVLGELAQSEWWFHFAGHATYGTNDAQDGTLELGGAESLRVADVLTLTRTPSEVVLSGCNTGRSPLQAVADMNLAHAFLAKGSRLVVAAVRPVKDDCARSFMSEVYDLAASDGLGLAESLRSV